MCSGPWAPLMGRVGNVSGDRFLDCLRECAFTLCVHGGGLDPCPKVFEAILAGVIPIAKRRLPISEGLEGLPVAFVERWSPSCVSRHSWIHGTGN